MILATEGTENTEKALSLAFLAEVFLDAGICVKRTAIVRGAGRPAPIVKLTASEIRHGFTLIRQSQRIKFAPER